MIGLIKDVHIGWWKRFEQIMQRANISHKLIDIEKSDWIEQISDCEQVIWRPNLREPYLSQAKEKLIIIEQVLKKNVYPNFDSFWHYDNKNAQVYLAEIHNLPFAKSFVSYNEKEIMGFLKEQSYPLISKSKGGASSTNVRMYRDFEQAKRDIEKVFRKGSLYTFFDKALNKINYGPNMYSGQKDYVNIQEFLQGNSRDFRVTTIGGKYSFAFFRENREGDFRASGSGLIDYKTDDHNHDIIEYFIRLSKRLQFDSMCYDILFRPNGDFVCIEFSYIFNDKAIYDCPGYYYLNDEKLVYIEKQTWPQELILKNLLQKWGIETLDESLNS